MSWNWCKLLGEHDFWAKIGSRAKIDRGVGAPPPPPRHLARLPDVALIRVNNYLRLYVCLYPSVSLVVH